MPLSTISLMDCGILARSNRSRNRQSQRTSVTAEPVPLPPSHSSNAVFKIGESLTFKSSFGSFCLGFDGGCRVAIHPINPSPRLSSNLGLLILPPISKKFDPFSFASTTTGDHNTPPPATNDRVFEERKRSGSHNRDIIWSKEYLDRRAWARSDPQGWKET